MSTYKLIKWYPSLPKEIKEGIEVNFYSVSDEYSDNPCGLDAKISLPKEEVEGNNFWEKVEYKLISYTVYDDTNLVTLRENGNYLTIREELSSNTLGATIEQVRNFWKEEDHKIYSVERLSDNKIFTVGDKVYQSNCKTNYFTITGFKMDVNNEHLLVLGNNTRIRLSKIEHGNPLFRTEDGVNVFEGDSLFILSTANWIIGSLSPIIGLHQHPFKGATGTEFKYFSTKDAADNYVLNNKPCLSINEVYSVLHIPRTKIEKLEELAKSKLGV